MFSRLRHMLIKEFLQVFRDPHTRFVIFFIPVFETLIFGYAVTTDVKHIALGVHDLDQSADSRELVARFERSGYFDVVQRLGDPRAAQDALDRGDVRAILHVNAGFQNDLRASRAPQVQLLLDGSDANTSGIVLQYAVRIASEYSGALQLSQRGRALGAVLRPVQVDLRSRAWFNANLESRNFFIPGIIALIAGLVTVILTSMAVVREREIGTLEQIMVTPLTRLEFILGKTCPFALIAFFDVCTVASVGVFWFDVPMRGSLLLFAGVTSLYILAMLGVGLLISTVCSTQQQALMSTFFFFFPAVLLSGFIFPIPNMPEVVQWITFADPLRYFLIAVRSIFLKGTGADVLWPQLAALAVIGVVLLGLAVQRFKKTLA